MNFYTLVTKTAFYSLLLLSCSFWATCRPSEDPEQETVINGHLVDAKTGKSVAGAYIDYRVYYMKDNMGFGDNGVIRPDTSGKFTIRYVGDKSLNPFNVSASGYLTKTRITPPIVNGQVNNVKIQMIPTDGTLHLKITNENNFFQKVYIILYTKTSKSELAWSGYQTFSPTLNQGASTERYVYFPSEEDVWIAWDKAELPLNEFWKAAHHDTLFLPQKDTILYNIKY